MTPRRVLTAAPFLLVSVLFLVSACGPPAAGTPSAQHTTSPVGASEDDGPVQGTGHQGGTGGEVGSVKRVVDGDTLEVVLPSGRERVRLIGIDTPESVKPDSTVECYGVAASQHLAELLPPGTEVELVRDVELRDRYDRLLAYVFRRSDGLFVNLAMAADGYANALTFTPNVTFADDMTAAVAQARQAGLGLWQACPDPDALFG